MEEIKVKAIYINGISSIYKWCNVAELKEQTFLINSAIDGFALVQDTSLEGAVKRYIKNIYSSDGFVKIVDIENIGKIRELV